MGVLILLFNYWKLDRVRDKGLFCSVRLNENFILKDYTLALRSRRIYILLIEYGGRDSVKNRFFEL